jgi:hypothetical protein
MSIPAAQRQQASKSAALLFFATLSVISIVPYSIVFTELKKKEL